MKIQKNQSVLDYWDTPEVESMYDKHLLNAEIRLILKNITENSKILDAGCGEGEGTLEYARVPGVIVHGADFSETRLKKAASRLKEIKNVVLKKVDFLCSSYDIDKDYDFIISQRFLINLPDWKEQSRVIAEFMEHLKTGGLYLMLEGSAKGVDKLNILRKALGLEPIPVKWHNVFFDDDILVSFMEERGYPLIKQDHIGPYFLLTRGIRPLLDESLNWDCDFNLRAANDDVKKVLECCEDFSRLKLWVFRK